MNINIRLQAHTLEKMKRWLNQIPMPWIIFGLSFVLSIAATIYSYRHDYIIAYGDAESHLNIAKRVVSGLTPGIAQLGGIWLPLPHLLMAPLVFFDPLWRTGFAGSIVSGVSYIVTTITIYFLGMFLTKNKLASFAMSLVFATNPNILYMQSTPMTELPLIAFFVLSTYFFVKFLKDNENIFSLILAGFFGFLATLSRYDGWFLVALESLVILLTYLPQRARWAMMQGRVILFATLAFFGIFLWFLWDMIILGDPMYFSHSQFSANAQQHGWLLKHQLPAYHDLVVSFLYYFVTAMSNSGVILFAVAIVGMIIFLLRKNSKERWFVALILCAPFIFNVLTLYIGQTLIFIPSLTPVGYEWRLFNVRYGILMVPLVAFFTGFLFWKSAKPAKILLIFLFLLQFGLYFIGYSKVITLADGVEGLSEAKRPDAEYWLHSHYDNGTVLLDDYSRLISIIRANIPMQNVIYIGSKPYWENALRDPEKNAKWIIVQKNDEIWKKIYIDKVMNGRLYKYYKKVYTSPEILIFERQKDIHT